MKKYIYLILKTHFDIFDIFLKIKIFMHTYVHMKKKSPSLHELSYLKLFKFSYLNLFHIMSTIFFFLFKTLPMNGTMLFSLLLTFGR